MLALSQIVIDPPDLTLIGIEKAGYDASSRPALEEYLPRLELF